MGHSFNVGDRVEVTGQPSRLFAGEIGVILEVTMRRADDPAYNVYWVSFREKRVRMIGVYLRPVLVRVARQVC